MIGTLLVTRYNEGERYTKQVVDRFDYIGQSATKIRVNALKELRILDERGVLLIAATLQIVGSDESGCEVNTVEAFQPAEWYTARTPRQ